MNDSLIGEEITLVSRAGEELLQLVLGACRAFLEAAEAKPSDMDGTEGRLRAAVRELVTTGTPALVARLVIVEGGVEIHLAMTTAPDSAVTVTCPA